MLCVAELNDEYMEDVLETHEKPLAKLPARCPAVKLPVDLDLAVVHAAVPRILWTSRGFAMKAVPYKCKSFKRSQNQCNPDPDGPARRHGPLDAAQARAIC
jgi:hypothetical protein